MHIRRIYKHAQYGQGHLGTGRRLGSLDSSDLANRYPQAQDARMLGERGSHGPSWVELGISAKEKPVFSVFPSFWLGVF